MSAHEFLHLAVDELEPDPTNPRTDLGDITDLAASMVEVGLLQPIVARRVHVDDEHDDRFVVVAGHRRLAAAQHLRWSLVPVVVRTFDDDHDVLVAMLVENGQRGDLDPIDEARAYQRLKDEHGLTDLQVARRVARSQPTVSGRLALLNLPAPEQEKVRTGQTTLQVAVRAGRIAGGTTGTLGVDRNWHFGPTHDLAVHVQARCERMQHSTSRRVGGLACGACWEAVIREDERTAVRNIRAATRPRPTASSAPHPDNPPAPRPAPPRPAPRATPSAAARQLPHAITKLFQDVEWLAAGGADLTDIARAVDTPPARLLGLYAQHGRKAPDVLAAPT